MDLELRNECIKKMDELEKYKISELFIDPIDPVQDGYPDYYDVIKTPMDLGIVRKKLMKNMYKSVKEWKNDIELIWTNTFTYFGEKSYMLDIATELQKIFRRITFSFSDSPSDDWINGLALLCDEYTASIKSLSQATPFLKKRSPTFTPLTSPSVETEENFIFTYDDIKKLVEDIKSFNAADKAKIREFLKSYEPQFFTQKSQTQVNISSLAPTTLNALRDEVDAIIFDHEELGQ